MWVATTETLVLATTALLVNKGVGGVVVKLTEDTWYKNPNAENQIRNAQAAGLQVSTHSLLTLYFGGSKARFHTCRSATWSFLKEQFLAGQWLWGAAMQPQHNSQHPSPKADVKCVKMVGTNLMFYNSVLAGWMKIITSQAVSPVNTAQYLQNFGCLSILLPKLSVNDAKSLESQWGKLVPGKLPSGNCFQGNTFDQCGLYRSPHRGTQNPQRIQQEGSLYKDWHCQ